MSTAPQTPTDDLAGRLVVSLDPSPATRDLVTRRIVEFAEELADDAALGEVVDALADDDEPIRSNDLAVRAGVTYRQVTYWTAEGYLTTANVESGSGRPHAYTREAVTKARIMGALVRLFAIAPSRASELADQIVTEGRVSIGAFTLTREGLSS